MDGAIFDIVQGGFRVDTVREIGFRQPQVGRVKGPERLQPVIGEHIGRLALRHAPGGWFIDDEGNRRAIDSGQVNAYLRQLLGADFTAKDFRTWGATLRAILLLACTPLPQKSTTEKHLQRQLNRCITGVVKEVAQELRNTPAVCRKSYINPVVFSAWRDGSLHKAIDGRKPATPRTTEKLALKLLSKAHKQRGLRSA